MIPIDSYGLLWIPGQDRMQTRIVTVDLGIGPDADPHSHSGSKARSGCRPA